jgi:hypothetical protein
MLGLAGLVLQVVGLAAFKLGWSTASARRRSDDTDARYSSIFPTPCYVRKGPEGGDL